MTEGYISKRSEFIAEVVIVQVTECRRVHEKGHIQIEFTVIDSPGDQELRGLNLVTAAESTDYILYAIKKRLKDIIAKKLQDDEIESYKGKRFTLNSVFQG